MEHKFPLSVIGSPVRNGDSWWQEVTVDSPWASVSPIDLRVASDRNILFSTTVSIYLATISDSGKPIFSTGDRWFKYAWVRVPAPEPKHRPMTADEIAALYPIWVRTAQSGSTFNPPVFVYPSGDVTILGYGLEHTQLRYAKSSTATEWHRFEVTEIAP